MIKRLLMIIPDEEVMNIPAYYKVSHFKYHEELLKDFCQQYQLGADTNKIDLFDMGCIILSAVDNLIVCEVAEKISENQFQKLQEQRPFIEKYRDFIGEIESDDILTIVKPPKEYKGSLLDYFYELVYEKCVDKRGVTR